MARGIPKMFALISIYPGKLEWPWKLLNFFSHFTYRSGHQSPLSWGIGNVLFFLLSLMGRQWVRSPKRLTLVRATPRADTMLHGVECLNQEIYSIRKLDKTKGGSAYSPSPLPNKTNRNNTVFPDPPPAGGRSGERVFICICVYALARASTLQ